MVGGVGGVGVVGPVESGHVNAHLSRLTHGLDQSNVNFKRRVLSRLVYKDANKRSLAQYFMTSLGCLSLLPPPTATGLGRHKEDTERR